MFLTLCYEYYSPTQMTTYDIRVNQRGSPTVLSLCDVMPLGDDDSTGFSYADALAVIKGHVPEGHKVLDTFTINYYYYNN